MLGDPSSLSLCALGRSCRPSRAAGTPPLCPSLSSSSAPFPPSSLPLSASPFFAVGPAPSASLRTTPSKASAGASRSQRSEPLRFIPAGARARGALYVFARALLAWGQGHRAHGPPYVRPGERARAPLAVELVLLLGHRRPTCSTVVRPPKRNTKSSSSSQSINLVLFSSARPQDARRMTSIFHGWPLREG